MREPGLRGAQRGGRKPSTATAESDHNRAGDLLGEMGSKCRKLTAEFNAESAHASLGQHLPVLLGVPDGTGAFASVPVLAAGRVGLVRHPGILILSVGKFLVGAGQPAGVARTSTHRWMNVPGWLVAAQAAAARAASASSSE